MALTGAAELLATWEAGLDRDAPGRALLLHRAARPEAGTDTLLSMPVGRRAADLFALRRALFGERMQVRIECAACGEAMEFDLDAGQFTGPSAQFTDPSAPSEEGPLRVAEGGWVVEFRLPTVADLAAVARAVADPAAAFDPPDPQHLLLTRCTVSAVRDGEPVPAGRLPGLLPTKLRRRLAEEAERADPAAETTLNIACPECGEATPAELDIAAYLWTELDAWARDVLLDVHLLATAYGWSEPEILALSPQRRRYYLELCADA
ncbi:hypothetical protein AB0D04_12745 [Streptomyces sp. NPDC048483]|uniref:T4 family baseplate hub assembly chaperone n=1 Tax=Streptomyces sp. NPDC048483 TaxID=3154927 RepID=UPI003423593E